jgi:TolA-binding protein
MPNIKIIPKHLLILLVFAGFTSAFAQQTLSGLSPHNRLKEGFDQLKRHNYQAAIKEFSRFSANSDATQDEKQAATYYSAHCALQLNHPDAEAQLLAYSQQYPGSIYEPRVFYDLGNHYYRIKKWDSAILYFSKIDDGQLDPDLSQQAAYESGVSCFQLQQYDRARTFFSKVKDREHPSYGSAAYFRAYLSFRDNQLDDALYELDMARNSPEFKPAIPGLKASILYKKKAFQDVIELGEAAFKDTAKISNPEELHMLVGESYFQKKDYKQAAIHFDSYTKSNKGNLPNGLQLRIALTYFQTDQTDKAIAGFRQVAARLDTTKGKADTVGQYGSYYLGVCYLKKEQKQFALNAFDQAAMMKGDARIQEVSWFNSGKLAYDLEKYDEAVETLKDFQDEYPNSEYSREANELIGEGLLNSNDFDAALAYMEKSKIKSERLNLAYQRAAYQRGTTHFNDGENSKAAEMFTQSLKYSQDKETQTAAHFWLAESRLKDRQYAEAAKEYAAVGKVEGSGATIYALKAKYGLGYAQYNLKEYSKALQNFKDFLTESDKQNSRTNYADACLRLADCQYATKDYTGALKSYDKAMDARTSDMDYAFYQKGVLYAVLKDFDNARTNFSIVVEKYQKSRLYDQALFQKAQMDFESTNYQAAIRGYSNIINSMPQSPVLPYCYLNRGISESNLKEYNAAVADFKIILNDYPNHPTANSAILGLQEALVQTGDVDQLNDYIAKYKKANPGSDALESIEFETSKALYNNQKYEKAIAGFQEYITNYAGSSFIPEAKFYLAESHYRGGTKSVALQAYKEIVAQGKGTYFIRSSFRVAELEYNNGNFQVSAQQYSILLNGVARTPKDINNATLGLIENLYQLGRYDSVALLSADLLKKENLSNEVSNKASLYAAKVYVGKGEYEKAIDELLSVVNNAQDINGAEAQYLVGDVFYKQKKHNESLAALFDLKSRFSAYPKWYNKGFLLIADNYIAQKENFQAQATLNSIIENSKDKETVAAAKSKLASMKGSADDQKP